MEAREETMPDAGSVGFRTTTGRWVLLATVLGSAMGFLDATVVNVALPAIGRDIGADVSALQWVLDGYLLTLAALILLGGSLADRYGRRRVFTLGVVCFMIPSVLCAVAPTAQGAVRRAILWRGGEDRVDGVDD